MIIGIIAMLINGADRIVFVPSGLIGGSIWTLGNFCIVPAIKLIGLGLAYLVWCGSCVVVGFAVGKLGLFGVEKDMIHHPSMNWAGFLLILVSMIIFFFIKPELKDQSSTTSKINSLYDDEEILDGADPLIAKALSPSKSGFEDSIPASFKTVIGFGLSIAAGVFSGTNLVPLKLWAQTQTNPPPLAFVLSHFTGVYLFSTLVFIVYCLIKRPPQIFAEATLPSFISGAMWAIAACGFMIATPILGFAIAVPLCSAGPGLINAFWSVSVFKEIRGQRNLVLLLGSMSVSIAGVVLVGLSH